MKKINYIKIILFLGLILNISCGKDAFNLDLTQNPNTLSEEQSDPDYLLNSVQVSFAGLVQSFGNTGARLTRIFHFSGRDYGSAYSPQSFDGLWSSAYAGILKDIQVMNKTAKERGLKHHIAIGKVIKAYTMMTMVDYFGDVPYSEAINDDILFPKADSGADVYAACINLLDEAIDNFADNALAEPANDFFYGGNLNKWIKLANTLKMRAYLNTRLVDSDALNKFAAIMASGDYIGADLSDSYHNDFEFKWGTNEINPDSRHPLYRASYTSTGAQTYLSNSFMDYMIGVDNDTAYGSLSNNFDPRTWVYFYRQTLETPGFDIPADEEVLECSLYPAPQHYNGYGFCALPHGYWGRDHGDDSGIPPDNFYRTLFGVYPAGGEIDVFQGSPKTNGDGDGGNGITPILTASWVQFMIAEYYMAQTNPDYANAKTYVFNGIELSMDKVFNFSPRIQQLHDFINAATGGAVTVDDWKNGLVANLSASWDAGTDEDKWNIWARQYFVALFGNGIDAYNAYRRTGYPHDLQPNLEPNPGPFIRSLYYPANSVNNNPNMNQKPGVDTQVFWDTNPASPGFPQSN